MQMHRTADEALETRLNTPMVTVGIDLAGYSSTTGVCRVTWGRKAIVELLPGKNDEDLLAAMKSVDKTGLDSPLGWPVDFTALLTAHRGHDELPTRRQYAARSDGRPGLGNSFTHRLTDDVAWKLTGAGKQRPLSVSADKLGVVAVRAAYLLERLAEGGEPVPRDGSGPVAEVYPASALIQWGLAPQETYKGKHATVARAKILEGLEKGLDLDLTDAVRTRCHASDHDLDALIAAAVARAAACGVTELPGSDEECMMAAVEGWIHLPRFNADLADLRGGATDWPLR
jgi:predicted nuclease with RNAse H fold